MRSNRTIQTIIQAVILALLAAIAFQLPTLSTPRTVTQASVGGATPPESREIIKAYRTYFDEWKKGELTKKADLEEVEVKGISVEGSVARAKLLITVKWKGPHNMEYPEGPLRNAPGVTGEKYRYAEVFTLRHWCAPDGSPRGWEFEGHLEPAELRSMPRPDSPR